VVTQNGIEDAHNQTAKAQAEQQAAQARIGQLQAYGDFAALKASRQAAVAGVADVRFDYERLMREIALVLPHDTYLTNLTSAPGGGTATAATGTATATGPTVNATGCAPSHKGVATALVRLRKLHNVESVDLTSSTKGAAATATSGGCKVTWIAVLTFKPESAPTTTQRVPARLGGGQ
jgi:Tfp pilus assembly protein PilN